MKATTAFMYLVRYAIVTVAISLVSATPSWAASLLLTGHDPDFRAFIGVNFTGARNLNKAAIN